MTLYPPISTLSGSLRSKALKRDVHYRLIGKEYLGLKNTLQIIFNDGQDFPALKMQSRVAEFNSRSDNCKVVVLGIDCGDRINEYGTVASADYKNRGNKAALYEQFMIRELIPEMYDRYGFGRSAGSLGYAGFSLGGLSAFDLTVRHPELFRFAGVFSGSFWWRHEPFTDDTPDDYRIMHESLETLPLDKINYFGLKQVPRTKQATEMAMVLLMQLMILLRLLIFWNAGAFHAKKYYILGSNRRYA